VATRWTEAVDAIANQAPDLILLDLKMPTIDGSSLLEFIRDEGNQVPVIIVSGFITDEVAQNLSKFGVSGFVRKPFKVSQLKDQVDRVLGVESVAAPPPQADTGSDESAAPPEPSTAKAPPESSPTASKPASIGSLYEDSEEESDPIEATPATPAQAPSEEEVLQILQKLDAPKTKPQPAAPPPPAPPPAKASEPTSEAPPPIPPPDPVAQAPDLTAAGQPGPAPEPVGEGHPEERRHRTHHRRHRSRRISRRSVLIYSAITVVCVIVAGFLAAIHWWESQGGLTEIQTKAGSAVKEQLKQELLKELQNQKR
jgi:CheY-like chemotaxis protein